nr:immunoglobulin light chain junction region [Macaca mulatta]MOW27420.1 immunoglobulin light chain junction region [Macaca mulatta]MOW27506.1 immunoglobulin light chain junction region [Macaca mulatta]MOW27684.1 immunoglobulin light chain junction region [Macaca mulatta]MOW28114.1 immunoglobulin light chain junction region [Macaca mulatta]
DYFCGAWDNNLSTGLF